ncbi:long-chain fatty acid--CoA ligase [Streptomyces sp. NPDC002668]|uniref:long-chain-fatty-acid--CoA ligase n=1 Tax=Streptomyces sp. NPDC002668 TaxID=3154422 RepID=UPI0033188DEF
MTLSLACILAESADRHTDRVALIEDDTHVTYGQLWLETRAYAAALSRLGVRPGDRVALLAPNTSDFPRAYYAILTLGAIVVPVHILLTAEEIAYIIEDSEATMMIAAGNLLGVGREAAEVAGVPLVSAGPAGVGKAEPSLDRISASVQPVDRFEPRSPEDPAVILYTSGTTGRPKGAVLTHNNLVMNSVVNGADVLRLTPDDVVLGGLPLSHTFGQTVAMNSTFRAGATLVLQLRFDAGRAIDLMNREQVNLFYGVPTMYIALLEAAPSRSRLPRLRLCLSGGSALPVSVLEKFNETFETTICEGYGLSETSPAATVNQPAQFGTKPGTVGHPLWGVEVEIARAEVDDRIEFLPTGERGEIVIRGHNVFAGYLNQPAATQAAIVDGWFRTGDIGAKDKDGFITILDRKKDLIIRGGFNVYPREVEEVLHRHPAVAQVAVIGIPHATLGEEVCAVIVPARGTQTPSPEEFIAWCQERLGRHKYPRRLEIVDELPLGPSLKVLYRELRQRFSES